MQFTQREHDVLKFTAHGYTPDEIGDFLGITRETVRKITCNIKLKAKLQKSTELAAYYWCKYFGTSLEDQRRQLISAIFAFIIILSIPIDFDNDRNRISYRRSETGYRARKDT
ncbi:regulatory LuxR family protein [Dysgonomonas alginatilytica]|uniref:Regulatory LuxR family protein n=1 Tax=Dysgonomonas alginatilytica TaxID=1605892 RepID=A0A2V3PKZ7_9BACT|nr:helix-turn-helix transcriptional regulator [Dysgonomonas alginatilytica]PXV61211.1 regulatory LuxR family protein [Dysgonomonas alginatilytica]